MDNQNTTIGKRLPRVDGLGKTTGETRFATDLFVDRMVYCYPFYSQVPFGKVKGIDTSSAMAVAGVLRVVTAEDIPGKNQVGVIKEDQPLFADKIARYIGDVVGVVVAETETAARKAANLVRVDIEPIKPYLSINESRDATDNFIHNDNLAVKHRVINGDIEAGFAQADYIIKADFVTPHQEHFYLEPQVCIAVPEDDGGITITGSIQCVFYVMKAVAKVLHIPFSKIRVIQAPIGGAFGGKEDVPSEVCSRAALAAYLIKRPVKCVYRREDDVQMTSKRHPFQMHYKVGVSKEGKLLAADILLEENAGAYATLSSVVSYRSSVQAMGPYVIPNIHAHSNSYYTNLPPTGAFRGFGSPQAAFGHERMMDIIAERLGIDPVELRLRNILKPGTATQTNHLLVHSVGAEETIYQAARAANWEQLKYKKPLDDRYCYGVGIGVCHYGNCLGAAGWIMDGSGAKIQIRRDGSVTLAYGLVEMGQGSLTANTQMLAEALGIAVERITILPTDTLNVPDSGPAVASRNVIMTGNAIRSAVEKIKPILIRSAAKLLDCKEDAVTIENDRVMDNASGNSLSFADLAEYLYLTNEQMDMLGWWHIPRLTYNAADGIGEAYFSYSFASQIAYVRVDKLTGQVKVLNFWAAHDVGKAINPAGLEGQVEGGTAQGTGYAVTEDFQLKDGKVITPNLSTYLLPTCMDTAECETIIVEAPEPLGPWGAKGIGEPAIIPTAAAIANAVSDAIGVQMNSIPLTPERVLKAIESKRV